MILALFVVGMNLDAAPKKAPKSRFEKEVKVLAKAFGGYERYETKSTDHFEMIREYLYQVYTTDIDEYLEFVTFHDDFEDYKAGHLDPKKAIKAISSQLRFFWKDTQRPGDYNKTAEKVARALDSLSKKNAAFGFDGYRQGWGGMPVVYLLIVDTGTKTVFGLDLSSDPDADE